MVKRKAVVDTTAVFSALSRRLQTSHPDQLLGKSKDVEFLLDLVTRTVDKGESNSLLILGPRGVGKTALVDTVLKRAAENKSWADNAVLVKLNGLLAIEDRIALKEITRQLDLDNVVGDKVFGSFSDHLTFLLSSLKSGNKTSKPIIFILEEFDMFCAHKNQTLLYNLFDVSQSRAVPICVIGISCQIDVTELLEKRVNSRFSHRYLHLMPVQRLSDYVDLMNQMLKLDKASAVPEYQSWNTAVHETLTAKPVLKFLEEKVFIFDRTVSFMKQYLYTSLLSMLRQGKQILDVEAFDAGLQLVNSSSLTQPLDGIIKDLSILEVCILIAIKHISEIYDHEPFNFEMVYHEFVKFRRRRLTNLTEERSVIFKCWENLIDLEFIVPKAANDRSRAQQLEYLLNVFHIPLSTLKKSIEKYPHCPTEVVQWLNSSTHSSGSFS